MKCRGRYAQLRSRRDLRFEVFAEGFVDVIDNLHPPSNAAAPRICKQDTVQLTVKTDAQARAMKMHQKHYWGTREWRKDFNRRTYIEGWFGVLKSATATGLNRGSHQFYGLATTTLIMTAAAAVTNMRLLRTWHVETGLGDESHPLLKPDEPFHGFNQLTAEEAAAIDGRCSPGSVAADQAA